MPLSGGEICVGTDPSVQIPVRAELGLLPRHFAVAERDGGWYIGAYTGAAVWVNGQPVSMTELHDGDRIVAGQLELTYRDEQAVDVPQVPATVPQGSKTQTMTLMPGASFVPAMPAGAHGLMMPGGPQVPMMPAATNAASMAGATFSPTLSPATPSAAPMTGQPTLLSRPMADPSAIVPLPAPPLRLGADLDNGSVPAERPGADRPASSGYRLPGRDAYLPKRSTPAPAESWNASDRYNPQKWSALKTGALAMMLLGMGLFACYVAMFELPGPLKEHDLEIKEARIVSAIRHHRRKGASWTEIKLAPGMSRVIELPDDLAVSPSWHGAEARVGFVKKYYDDKHLNMMGNQVPLKVVTMEVGGKIYRSLAKHNTVQEGENQLITLAGPCMVIGGVFLLIVAFGKGKKQGL